MLIKLLLKILRLNAVALLSIIIMSSVAFAGGGDEPDPEYSASISQSGGSQWLPDERVTVRWSSNVEDPVYTVVFLRNVNSGETFTFYSAMSSSTGGSASWTVGELLYEKHVPPGFYRARVSVTDSIINGFSGTAETSTFEIVGEGSCRMSTVITGNGSGTISPAAEIIWDTGSKTVNFHPASGSYVYRVKVNIFTLADSEGRFLHPTSVTRSCTSGEVYNVEVEFRRVECRVVVLDKTGGHVEPPTQTIIPAGQSVDSVTTADTGYVIKEVKIQDKNQLTYYISETVGGQNQKIYSKNLSCPSDTPKLFTIDPYFKLEGECNVTSTVAGNGTVSPPSKVLEKDEQETFSFSPATGFVIDKILVNDVDYGVIGSKTIRCPGGEDYGIRAEFKAKPCQLRTDSSDGGSINPDTGAEERKGFRDLDWGQSITIQITPDPGYRIEDVTENDESVGAVSTHRVTCHNPEDNIAVEATFVADKYKLDSSVEPSGDGLGGKITPLGEVERPLSEEQLYAAVPNKGYLLDWLKIDNEIVPNFNQVYFEVGPDLTDDTPDRTVVVKYKLACRDILPEETIENLQAGDPAQINLSSFRDWVDENTELVLDAMTGYQCEYVGNATMDEVVLSNSMASATTGSIKPLINAKKPAVGLFQIIADIKKYYPDNSVEVSEGVVGHSVLIDSLTTSVQKSSPPVTTYNIGYLDPNGPTRGSLSCEGTYIQGGARVIDCNIPLMYRYDEVYDSRTKIRITFEAKRLFLVVTPAIAAINSELLGLSSVRGDAISWSKSNYTRITNQGTQGSPQGICSGWAEFNARAAQLIKECPWTEDGQKEAGTK